MGSGNREGGWPKREGFGKSEGKWVDGVYKAELKPQEIEIILLVRCSTTLAAKISS
jgi:hypothetical protein